MLSNINIIYINLDSRKDRRFILEKTMQQLYNFIPHKLHRFSAIKSRSSEHRAVGCTRSHIACISLAKEMNWPMVIIIEDDICFTNMELFANQIQSALHLLDNWDVIMLAGNNLPGYQIITDSYIKVHNCKTTTGYLISNHYYTKLIDNYTEGLFLLCHNKKSYSKYAIDKWWFSLQEKDNWYLIIPLTITQHEGHSDILCKKTNYSAEMLDLK